MDIMQEAEGERYQWIKGGVSLQENQDKQ